MSSKYKKKHKKKSYYRHDPLDSVLDLAGGLVMSAIAGKMEEKHHYIERGKVNPYAVSALGIASGKMRTTEDIVRKGALLGAMGVFDDDSVRVETKIDGIDNDVFETETIVFKNNSQNTWREYCQSGEEYGLNPEDFDNADDYEDALSEAKVMEKEDPVETVIYMAPEVGGHISDDDRKYRWRKYCVDGSVYGVYPEDYETADDYADALKRAGYPAGRGIYGT